MKTKKTLVNTLYYITNTCLGALGLIYAYLLAMIVMALFGFLPNDLRATYELPLELHNAENYYTVSDLDSMYVSQGIEVKKAELEVLPDEPRWSQVFAYLQPVIYLGFFMAILHFLSKILVVFRSQTPFSISNVHYLRWIGLITIALGCYKFLIGLIVANTFYDKFEVKHATIIGGPSIWDFNYVAIFLGLVFLVLAEVFKTGHKLQELEEQTV